MPHLNYTPISACFLYLSSIPRLTLIFYIKFIKFISPMLHVTHSIKKSVCSMRSKYLNPIWTFRGQASLTIELSYGWFVRDSFAAVSHSPFVGSDSMSMSVLRLGYRTNPTYKRNPVASLCPFHKWGPTTPFPLRCGQWPQITVSTTTGLMRHPL